MSKTLIGINTYGLLDFTKLTVKSIIDTVKHPFDICIVVGKPADFETISWVFDTGLHTIIHDQNYGFPKGLNDLYDFAWKMNNYDYLIISGPDIIAYPNTIDLLIDKAETSDWEWISSSQFDVKALVSMYPETKEYFHGPNLVFNDFGTAEPWMVHKDWDRPDSVEPNVIKDVHNLCLYKKSVMDAIGYIDTGFYPAYYSDNDYARRGVNAGLKTCALSNSVYFHFWSRTLHQGTSVSNDKYFNNNRKYYIMKWGGDFGKEKWLVPFNGENPIIDGIQYEGNLNINTRDREMEIINHWKNR
jgi:GT2 family glycosyltransferase